MSVETNKAVILKAWESVSKGDPRAVVEMYHEDVAYHGSAGEEITGRDGLLAMISGYFTAMPDIKAQVEDVVGEGDRVFTRVRLSGTNTGEFMGKPASGRRVDIGWLMTVARLQDGKVVEEWEVFDRLDMLSQLGHVP